jgi:hypothetical protein
MNADFVMQIAVFYSSSVWLEVSNPQKQHAVFIVIMALRFSLSGRKRHAGVFAIHMPHTGSG